MSQFFLQEHMETHHRILISDSRNMDDIEPSSIDLVVTSPPYPMISMWDELFSTLSSEAKSALAGNDGNSAFEAMHVELDKVWSGLFRVLKPGSFACINIGDATRTIDNRFRLYSNHSRIISTLCSLGFDSLPVILWQKQTNAPNKFMGSGMLPAGAYVTLEHEYILIFRKGEKKDFGRKTDKERRMQSAFFWEERNKWFSDTWDFKGTGQSLDRPGGTVARSRSAAFPFELAYRLVNMYSSYEDTVLDPFVGTGTSVLAAIATGRNSIGIELDPSFSPLITEQSLSFIPAANAIVNSRLSSHKEFISAYCEKKGPAKYTNTPHGFPVVTNQETGMRLYTIGSINESDAGILVTYEPLGATENPAIGTDEQAVVQKAESEQAVLEFD
jgi:DNA modification methylase